MAQCFIFIDSPVLPVSTVIRTRLTVMMELLYHARIVLSIVLLLAMGVVMVYNVGMRGDVPVDMPGSVIGVNTTCRGTID